MPAFRGLDRVQVQEDVAHHHERPVPVADRFAVPEDGSPDLRVGRLLPGGAEGSDDAVQHDAPFACLSSPWTRRPEHRERQFSRWGRGARLTRRDSGGIPRVFRPKRNAERSGSAGAPTGRTGDRRSNAGLLGSRAAYVRERNEAESVHWPASNLKRRDLSMSSWPSSARLTPTRSSGRGAGPSKLIPVA